ncbi:juvenile hormone esterase-like [Cotesia glomerata]|uniref:juvenile hormone esterase-like n=1 Tax=Cotesia glomerata TaxID=32391 RepID=UPI001D01352B|nr:juvenile hormone esterase-like [Cotesia glomerata]
MEHPIVKIQEGLIRGVEKISCDGVKFLAFKGIPYAEPPVGPRRFRDSEPVKPWSGILDASRHSKTCGQINWFNKTVSGDDDCLYLNVYTRDLTGRKPVIFTIHGGNFSFGSGNDNILGPDFLVEELIVVTINYRVGILGFLNLEDESAPGNQGLKDLVLALNWVARNISNFGGDSGNVTIYGYSAGSAAVHYLAISPLAEGLFHKAILQSGVSSNPWASVSIDSMKESAVKIAGALGFESKDLVQVLQFLKTVKIRDLLEATACFSTWKISVNTFGPSVDSCAKNSFLEIPVEEAIKKGIRVPCILGSTTHEAVMQLAGLNDEHLALMNQNQNLVFHPSTARFLKQQNIPLDVVRRFFMDDKEISRKNIENVIQLMSFIHFLADVQHILKIQQVNNVPCYYFKFGYFSENTAMIQKIMKTNLKGAAHCEDVGYLFNMKAYNKIGIEPPKKGTVEWTIQRRFIEFWTNFAKTGNPNPGTSKVVSEVWSTLGSDQNGFTCLQMSSSLSTILEPNLLVRFRTTPSLDYP